MHQDHRYLAQRIQTLETILSTVDECYKVVDDQFRLIDMNAAGLCMIEAPSIDVVKGASVLDLVLPEYHDVFRDSIRRALDGERVTQEFQIQGLNGTRRWMQQTAVVLPPEIGESQSRLVAAFTRDITPVQRALETMQSARDQAEQASRMKGEFLANMSHELRTPMTAILGYADLLTSENEIASDVERSTELAESIQSNAHHLLTIINDVLDVSKIEAGQMAVESIKTDPEKVVEEVLSLVRPRATAKGIDLRISYDSTIPEYIQSDPTRLRQILLNIVGNAIKFTEHGSVTIHVSMSADRSLMMFRVVDTGIGMTPEQCERVMRLDAFSQADSSTTRKFGGTGLGLRISNALASILGGALSIKSTIGVGSAFTVSISATGLSESMMRDPEDVADSLKNLPTPRRCSDTGKAKRLTGARIMLAEDGLDNQRLVSFYLRQAGAEVVICNNGLVAAERIEESAADSLPDLILMDIQMPELDGYGATRRLRAAGYTIPIVALTAHAMAGDRQKCLDAGCDDYLIKPIDKLKLVDTCVLLAGDASSGSQAA